MVGVVVVVVGGVDTTVVVVEVVVVVSSTTVVVVVPSSTTVVVVEPDGPAVVVVVPPGGRVVVVVGPGAEVVVGPLPGSSVVGGTAVAASSGSMIVLVGDADGSGEGSSPPNATTSSAARVSAARYPDSPACVPFGCPKELTWQQRWPRTRQIPWCCMPSPITAFIWSPLPTIHNTTSYGD